MALVPFTCSYCGNLSHKEAGHINRQKKNGAVNFYCNRDCSGAAKRKEKSQEQKKLEKQAYDKHYRTVNREMLKEKKAAAFKEDYAANPEKYREQRKRRAKAHAEYIRTPKYRLYKKEYDVKYLAKKQVGPLWESLLLLREIEKTNEYTVAQKFQDGIVNKSQKRKCN